MTHHELAERAASGNPGVRIIPIQNFMGAPEEAIRRCGQLLVDSGYVESAYVEGMLEREKSFSTAIGNHVAIPHGTNEAKGLIRRTGMVVMTYPAGIPWNGDTVKLVVGIAALGGEHPSKISGRRAGPTPLFAALADSCDGHSGLWNAEAEQILFRHFGIK